MGTITETARPDLDDGDHDRFAHYAKRADIMRSMIEGTPVTAMCGKKWVPTRNPEKYPVCPTCKELFELLKTMEAK